MREKINKDQMIAVAGLGVFFALLARYAELRNQVLQNQADIAHKFDSLNTRIRHQADRIAEVKE